MKHEIKRMNKDDVDQIMFEAKTLFSTNWLPDDIKKPEQAFAKITLGREIGLKTWASLTGIYIQKGIPTLKAETMLSIIRSSGHSEKITQQPIDNGYKIIMVRKGGDSYTAIFDKKRASEAGLLGKLNWKTHFQTMCRWRCISECAKALYSDIIGGFYTPDEIQEIQEIRESKIVDPSEEVEEAEENIEEQEEEKINPRQIKFIFGYTTTRVEPFSFALKKNIVAEKIIRNQLSKVYKLDSLRDLSFLDAEDFKTLLMDFDEKTYSFYSTEIEREYLDNLKEGEKLEDLEPLYNILNGIDSEISKELKETFLSTIEENSKIEDKEESDKKNSQAFRSHVEVLYKTIVDLKRKGEN